MLLSAQSVWVEEARLHCRSVQMDTDTSREAAHKGAAMTAGFVLSHGENKFISENRDRGVMYLRGPQDKGEPQI